MIKFILIGIVFFAAKSNVFSQNNEHIKIDSLKKALPSLHDSAKVDCLNELSGIYIKFIRDTLGYCELPLCETNTAPLFSSLASDYAELAYEEAVKINYIHGIAESLSYKGEIERFSDHFLSEEKFSREAINWYRKTPNKKRLAETYFNLSHSQFPQSFFSEAIKNLDTAYEWHKKNDNTDGMFWTLSVSSALYHESGNYEKAFELARKCLDIAIENKNDWFKRVSLTDIGWLFQDIEDYKTALEYYRQTSVNVKLESLGFAEIFTLQHQYDSARYYYGLVDTSDQRTLRFYLTSIGEYYFLQEQYDKALPNFTRALDYHRQLNDRNPVMRTLLDIAKTYLALGNNDSAFAYGNESLSIAKQTVAKQVIRDASKILASVYDHWHQSDSAYFYYRQYTVMKDSVLNNQVKGKFAAYTFDQKMELLNKEKQIQQVQLQNQSLLGNILTASIIILLLLAAIIFRNINLKRKNERQRLEHDLKLQKMESEKNHEEFQHKAIELEMQALRAQMNPHFIFNCLSSINRFILKNESESASDYLTKFSRLIRMVLTNSKKELITLDDELEMLRLYLEMERLRFKFSFDYNISFKNEIDPENSFIPPLLLQPFAENAIWHGLMNKEGQGHLTVLLSKENNLLNCIIEDNGVGRAKAAALKSKSVEKKKSLGLEITKERLALLNRDSNATTFFELEDLYDNAGNAMGTRVILKIRLADRFEEHSLIS